MTGRRAVAIGLWVALLLGLAPSPAEAGSTTITDPAGDNVTYDSESPDYADLTKIVVRHTGKALKVTVYGESWDGLEVYLDTRAKRKGPEFLVSWEQYLSEEVFLSTTTKDWDVAKGNIKCKGARSKGDADSVTFVVPRSCLAKKGKKPARLRANVESVNFYDSFARDEAPAFHEFTGWIKAG